MVMVEMRDEDVRLVIDTFAGTTGINFVYAEDLRGRASVVTPRPVPPETAYVIFESSLLAAGFKVVERPDGVLEVVPAADAERSSTRRRVASAGTPRSPAEIFSEARILPKWESGRMVGVQVSGIKPGSIFEELGVENGEVITELNGIAIDSPEASAEVMLELVEPGSFDLTLRGPNGQRTLSVLLNRSALAPVSSRGVGRRQAAEQGEGRPPDEASALGDLDPGSLTVDQAARLVTERTGRRFLYSSAVGALRCVTGRPQGVPDSHRRLAWGVARPGDFDEVLRDRGLRLTDAHPGLEVITRESFFKASTGAPSAPLSKEREGQSESFDSFEEREAAELVQEIAGGLGVTVLFDDRLRGKVNLTGTEESARVRASSVLRGALLAIGFRVVRGPASIWAILPLRPGPWQKISSSSEPLEELVPLVRRVENSNREMHLSYRDAEVWELAEDLHAQLDIDSAHDDRFRGRFSLVPGGNYPGRDALRIAQAIMLLKGFEALRGPADVVVIVPAREARSVETALDALAEAPPLRLVAPVTLEATEWELADLISTFSRKSGQVFAVSNLTRGRLRFWSRRSFEGRDASSLIRMLVHMKGMSLFLGDSGIAYVVPARHATPGIAVTQGRDRETDDPVWPIELDQMPLSEFFAEVARATGVARRGTLPHGNVSLVGNAKIRKSDLPELAAGFLAMFGREVTWGDDGTLLVGGPEARPLLARGSGLFSEARILPKWANGRMVGVQVSGIMPGSIFDELGMENGEVITELNGIAIDSPEASAEVMLELIHADTFEVTVEGVSGQRTLVLPVERSVEPEHPVLEVFSQASILPMWDGARLVGIQVSAIEPGSIFEQMGMEDGDVITSLNGIAIDSPEASAEMMLELTEAETLEAVVDGPNGPRTLNTTVKR